MGIIPAFIDSGRTLDGILQAMCAYSLYLHIPFCRHRCGYCDFNTYANLDELIEPYVRALCREIDLVKEAAGEKLPVHTIFYGGGTPSLLPARLINQIYESIENAFQVDEQAEITLEANPGTLTPAYLTELRTCHINRLSVGMQSANPTELRLLEREHDYFDVIQAFYWARSAGFKNINLDLIFGLPGQSLENWKNSLDYALRLAPDHLSLYALTIEHGTPLRDWVNRGLLQSPDADTAADMYEWSSNRLAQDGYEQYEISNWARQTNQGELLACRHNLQYWLNQPYLGLGAGAHGYANQIRYSNVLAPAAYIQRCQNGNATSFPTSPAAVSVIPIQRQDEIGETMMMGLRLTQRGLSSQEFLDRFGISLEDYFPDEIAELILAGLLEWHAGHLRLTSRGRLLGNQVFVRFI